MMNESNPYEILEKIENDIPLNEDFTEYEIEQLSVLSLNDDESVRANVATLLINTMSQKGEAILITLLEDNDSLVRLEVADSLRYSRSVRVFKLLKEMAVHDDDSMV